MAYTYKRLAEREVFTVLLFNKSNLTFIKSLGTFSSLTRAYNMSLKKLGPVEEIGRIAIRGAKGLRKPHYVSVNAAMKDTSLLRLANSQLMVEIHRTKMNEEMTLK